METIPGGSWGKIKIFKSFSEMAQDFKRRQGPKLKEDEPPSKLRGHHIGTTESVSERVSLKFFKN